MPSKLRSELKSPSPAFVLSCLALFVALGGSSYAAVKLSKNSVRSVHIKRGAVHASDIARGAVSSAKVLDGTLQADDFGSGVLLKGDKGEKGDPGEPGQAGAIGPTEGKSTDQFTRTGTPLTSDALLADGSSLTTTRAGHLLVAKTLGSVTGGCASMSTWRIWLLLDGVRVPGTMVTNLPSPTTLRGTTLIGVTGNLVPAGLHQAAIAVDCETGSGFSSAVSHTEDFTAVVLGDG